jgi:hypothetical protein
MADFTLEQQQAIAIAEAKMKMAQANNKQTNSLGIPVGEGERIMPVPPEQSRSVGDYIKPIVEVPATMLSNAALAIPSAFANPKQPTALMEKYSYKPESPVTKDILGGMADALRYVPPYIGTGLLPTLGKNTQLLKQPAEMAVQAPAQQLAQALRKEPVSSMSGVGAAEVPKVMQRANMAQNLRVPVPTTKGDITRDLGQQAFEAETIKTYPEIGKPILQRKLEGNEAILQNFDEYIDATGKEKYGLIETGRVVDKALVNASERAKKDIRSAYDLARKSGETAQLIDVKPVQNYLNSLEAEAINAPVITSAKMKLDKLAKDGQLSINDLEEVRKMVGEVSSSTPTNMTFGKKIKNEIDTVLENQGGDLYKEARALRSKYAKDFENIGYVDKLLSKKPGTTDRSVALEDVFSHSILSGSRDDVRNIGATLKKAGPEGQQAWKELQGQTIQHIKDEVTKNVERNANGSPVVSPARFNSIVRTLDQDGKLEYIFGKKGAEEIRNLSETAMMINSPLKGAVNTSNTSSAYIRGLDLINKSPLSAIPGVKSVTKNLAESAKEKAIKKQVEESINFDPKRLAEQLRKEQ